MTTVTVVTALCSALLLLLASGPAKLRRPAATVSMLAELGLPGRGRLSLRALARAIGVIEVAVASVVPDRTRGLPAR